MYKQAGQRRNFIARTGCWSWALLLVLPASAPADVREPGRIRLARESLLPALPGQPYSGVVEFTSPDDGVVERVEIGGVGWEVRTVGSFTAIDAKRGETIRIPFQADVKDGVGKLEVRVTVNGERVEKKFDLSPERIAAIGKDRPASRVNNGGAAPPGNGGGGPTAAGCDDYLMRVHGRIEYVRPDGQAIGADGIRYQIIDDDTVDSEIIYEAHTDEQGNFDITTCWDDCDISGCDDPDIYLRFFCDTGVLYVRNDDAGEDIYSWSTIDSLIFNDSPGGDVDFGVQRPGDANDFPVLHIHNSIVRTHRYVTETSGYVSAQAGVVWQDGNGAFYSASDDEIYIGPDEQWNEGTQAHEWGHHLLYEWTSPVPPSYCNGFCDATPSVCGGDMCGGGGGHCIWCNETDTDAWNEGFPNWLGSVVMRIWQGRYNGPLPTAIGDTRYTLELLQNCCDNTAHNALTTEGFVAALLRDMEDPPQDAGQTACPQDALALNGDEILAVVRQARPIRVTEFITAFRIQFPQFDHDFRSTAQSISAAYVVGWTSAPLQVLGTSGCGAYRNGETITLSVQTNASRFSTCMQWRRDGTNLMDGGRVSGATTDALTITDAGESDAGQYTLRITSCDGAMPNQCAGTQTTTSAPISVRVIDANPPAYRVTGWGRNTYGGLGRGTFIPDFDVNPGYVINLNNVVAVTGGQWNSHALLADGTVWGWGYQYLGDGTNQTRATPVQANGLTDIVAVSSGGGFGTSMALDASGHVWTWGDGGTGQLGIADLYLALNPVQLNLECVVDISMGYYSAAAVTGDGSLWVWGLDYYGQFGLGTGTIIHRTPQRVTDLSNVVEVEVGAYHNLVRLADGTVWAAGWNANGQLGDGTVVDHNRFVQTIGLSNVTQISAGWQHNLAVRSDGTPWAWGHISGIGTGSNNLDNPTPAPVLNLPTVRSLDAGNQLSAFVDENGTIWTCGFSFHGALGRPPTPLSPANLPAPVDTRVGAAVQVSAGGEFMMAIAPGARIIAPVTDQIAAGCATAQLTVGAVGEPPLSYQWLREIGGTFVPLNDNETYSGTMSPTLTITETDALDTGVYRVAVANATNVVFNDPIALVTPPLLNPFSTQQNATEWWNNERGNWAVIDGAYSAAAPADYPATYSSFELPLRDFLIELDVTNTALSNYNANGGIWLRSQFTNPNAPNYPSGVLLGFGSVYPYATGDLFWQRYPEGPQNVAYNAYTPGAAIHLRVEVRGNTFTAYLNDSPTPTTTLTTPNYPSGNIALYDNAAAGVAFDNVFIQSLTSCEPGSAMEPVRIIQRPQSQMVPSGAQVTLSVVATGTGPLDYQWLRNGACIEGPSENYQLTATTATAGRYECAVTNACGSVGSYPAFVTVSRMGDSDGDDDVDRDDYADFVTCVNAPQGGLQPGCAVFDFDGDAKIDLLDFAGFQIAFNAP
ncbi:MAG: DUF1080 domain-containing protein [Phycisphaerales bacterium]|nr:DUF1080 domain-containing protein [Phycisphaerales bacterium]